MSRRFVGLWKPDEVEVHKDLSRQGKGSLDHRNQVLAVVHGDLSASLRYMCPCKIAHEKICVS